MKPDSGSRRHRFMGSRGVLGVKCGALGGGLAHAFASEVRRWALCTRRSRMASATVGLAIISCQCSTWSWLVTIGAAASMPIVEDLQEVAALIRPSGWRAPSHQGSAAGRARWS